MLFMQPEQLTGAQTREALYHKAHPKQGNPTATANGLFGPESKGNVYLIGATRHKPFATHLKYGSSS